MIRRKVILYCLFYLFPFSNYLKRQFNAHGGRARMDHKIITE